MMGKIVHSSSPDNTALGGETQEKMAVSESIRSLIGIQILKPFTATECVPGRWGEFQILSNECTKKKILLAQYSCTLRAAFSD